MQKLKIMGANNVRVVQASQFSEPLTRSKLLAEQANNSNKFRQSSLFDYWKQQQIEKSASKTDSNPSTASMSELPTETAYHKYGKIMPASIQGSKQYCNKKFLDLIAMIGQFGAPNFFITLTANDNWEGLREVLGGRATIFSPVETTVFFIRRFHLLHDVLFGKSSIFGEVSNYFYRVEFQRRGSPHIHAFIWVSTPAKEQVVYATLEPLPDLVRKYE